MRPVPLSRLTAGNGLVRIVVPQPYETTGLPSGTSEPSQVDAEVVEGGDFRIISVEPAEESGFTHFLDGSQKSWLVGYCGLYPIYFSHVSAAIIPRLDRVMRTGGAQTEAMKRFFGVNFQDCPEFSHVAVDIGIEQVKADGLPPDAAAERIVTAISSARSQIEDRLSQNFEGGVLLVDGGLGNSLRAGDPRSIVGVVKSHRRQYFASLDRAQAVLAMKPGDRSVVFKREAGKQEGQSPYSFYLKLYENPNQGPMFGLIRVELPPNEEWVSRANEVASWVLAERAPSSRPDPRYDRMLYPIRLVEQYLKAQQPSDAWVRGLLGK